MELQEYRLSVEKWNIWQTDTVEIRQDVIDGLGDDFDGLGDELQTCHSNLEKSNKQLQDLSNMVLSGATMRNELTAKSWLPGEADGLFEQAFKV